ncbi:MAG TPA: PqqD family protein [Marine Group III euryarchaeote]|nr:PqqD family protein [Marine Group III euryarchaeote]
MSRKDVLNHKPCRTDSEEVKWFYEDEIVVITYPKKFGKMEKWLQSRIGGPEEVRRPLDKFSSYIWEICDGETTVADVVRKFDEKFGEEVAPASDRVQIFLETLLGLNLIELK